MQPTLKMIEAELILGNLDGAARLLALFQENSPPDDRVWQFHQVIRRFEAAELLANSGQFDGALEELKALAPHCSAWSIWVEKRAHLAKQKKKFMGEMNALVSAQHRGAWSEAMVAARRAQRICPKLPLSQLLKHRTEDNAPLSIADQRASHHTQAWGAKKSSRRNVRVSDDSGSEVKSERLMMWVDGVGGYLVCLAPIVTLGQAIPGSHVDIPFQADISRRHAILRRTGEGYVIDPLHDVKVNDKPVTEATYLLDGDEIALGSKLKLRFVKKYALSATARLDFLSRHRTSPSADGILLMGESLLLGRHSQSHIVCRESTGDVVFFRRPEGLGCRSTAPITIGGRPVEGKSPLPFGEHLSGEGLSVTLERLD